MAFATWDDRLTAYDLNQASDVCVDNLELDDVQLISRRQPDLPDVTGQGISMLGSGALSADGRVIAFLSSDNLLTPNDTNELVDVIVRDLTTGSTYAPAGARIDIPPNYWFTNAASAPAVSADGRIVVYGRYGLPRFEWGLYRFVIESNQWEVVDRFPCSNDYGPQSTGHPSVSSDGQLVAFETLVTANAFVCNNIVEHNSGSDIILRYFALATNYHRIVSHNLAGTATGNGDSQRPQISPDSQWVLFQSMARDLVANSTPANVHQFYAYELASDQIQLVSQTPNGAGLPDHASNAVFSADARWVVFQSGTSLYRYDLGFGHTNELLVTNGMNPTVSADGRWVAFESLRDQGSGISDIRVVDLQTSQTELISENRFGNGPANDSSTSPLISPDGRLVVFASQASDLVEHDVNGHSDVFVRFRASGVTLALSHSILNDGTGNGISSNPVLSADGLYGGVSKFRQRPDRRRLQRHARHFHRPPGWSRFRRRRAR